MWKKMSRGSGQPGDVESRRLPALLLCVVLGLSMQACGGGGGGGGGTADTGGGDEYGGNDDDEDDAAIQPTLASIQANVFTPICTQCHAGSSAPQGLRLEEGMSYGMLVNVASSEVPSLLRVEPGNPDDSYLIHKLEGTQSVGERMPLGGPYLTADTIAAIRQWITDGAADSMIADDGLAAKTSLSAAWPVDGSSLRQPPSAITLIADGELDTSALHGKSVVVGRLGDIDNATLSPIAMRDIGIEITSLAPTVVRLTAPAGAWSPGRYEVVVKGGGATPVIDRAGRLLDGDGDGEPGGDFVLRFDIEQP